jgi:hypothetical protein
MSIGPSWAPEMPESDDTGLKSPPYPEAESTDRERVHPEPDTKEIW